MVEITVTRAGITKRHTNMEATQLSIMKQQLQYLILQHVTHPTLTNSSVSLCLGRKLSEIDAIIVAIVGIAMTTKITTTLQQSTMNKEEFVSIAKAMHTILPNLIPIKPYRDGSRNCEQWVALWLQCEVMAKMAHNTTATQHTTYIGKYLTPRHK
jgi:hypothetical protein